MPRRSERLAIKEAIRFAKERARLPSAEREPEPAAAPAAAAPEDPHAPERQRIIGILSECKARCCATLETKLTHEAKCEWCRTHPEWRLINHNLNTLMEQFEKIRTKDAKRSAALGIVCYINDNAIEFAKAHEKFRLTILDRCEHFIAESGDNVLLRMICSDVIRKLATPRPAFPLPGF